MSALFAQFAGNITSVNCREMRVDRTDVDSFLHGSAFLARNRDDVSFAKIQLDAYFSRYKQNSEAIASVARADARD